MRCNYNVWGATLPGAQAARPGSNAKTSYLEEGGGRQKSAQAANSLPQEVPEESGANQGGSSKHPFFDSWPKADRKVGHFTKDFLSPLSDRSFEEKPSTALQV